LRDSRQSAGRQSRPGTSETRAALGSTRFTHAFDGLLASPRASACGSCASKGPGLSDAAPHLSPRSQAPFASPPGLQLQTRHDGSPSYTFGPFVARGPNVVTYLGSRAVKGFRSGVYCRATLGERPFTRFQDPPSRTVSHLGGLGTGERGGTRLVEGGPSPNLGPTVPKAMRKGATLRWSFILLDACGIVTVRSGSNCPIRLLRREDYLTRRVPCVAGDEFTPQPIEIA